MASGGYWVQLDVRPVRNLRPHEETIESSTREMVALLTKDGIQKDPIIIDGTTGVVLDGMHRLSAFGELGLEYAVCCPVDYQSPSISVGRWLRVYKCSGKERPRDLAEDVGLTRSSGVSEALGLLDRKEVSAAVLAGGKAYFPPQQEGSVDGFKILKAADAAAQSRKWERTFAGEEELENHTGNPSEAVLLVRRFGKDEVLSAGIKGRLFPCKTSMHTVDPRPVAVNVPLAELKSGAKETVTKRMFDRHFEMLPADSVYEGRKYKERLLVLSGK